MKNRSRVMIMTAGLLIVTTLWLPGLRSRRVAAQSPVLMGSDGFMANLPYAGGNSSPAGVVGVLKLDGAGNVTGSETVVSPDPSPNATTVQAQAVSFTGTYTVNADGTGSLTIVTPQPSTDVRDHGRRRRHAVRADGRGNYIVTGTARKQWPFHDVDVP